MAEILGPTLPVWLQRSIAAFRLGGILFVLLCVLLALFPVQLFALRFAPRLAARLPMTFHRVLLWLFGIRVRLEGALTDERPLLIVSNHISLLDIPILATIAPLSFVSKSEVGDWPVIGLLARMQRTVFVQRGDRRKVGQQTNEIAERLIARETMVLFPEGTTGDANVVLPFKTSLFEAAKVALKSGVADHAQVQPVAIHYNKYHGMPLSRAERPHVAWLGEFSLFESLMPLALKGGLDVTVRCAPAMRLDETSNRKAIAAHSRNAIRSMLTGGFHHDGALDRTS